MISSARCIQARASIVRCPTVRMPVPTTTSDPAFASLIMVYPAEGNTPRRNRPRIAAETEVVEAAQCARSQAARCARPEVARCAEAGETARCAEAGETARCARPEAARCVEAGEAARCARPEAARCVEAGEAVEMPGPVAFPRDGPRPSRKHRFLERFYLLPKGSQQTSRLRDRAGIHRASVHQWQDLTKTLSILSP